MQFKFNGISISAITEEELSASKLFSEELLKRTSFCPNIIKDKSKGDFVFTSDNNIISKDTFTIKEKDNRLFFTAKTVRGLIFAYSLFLRKAVFENSTITLCQGIEGEYSPKKEIRGHQMGYRPLPNTYDAWSYEDFRRYYLDTMAFGSNTAEQILITSPKQKNNCLMKYSKEEILKKTSQIADSFDLDFSIWCPNEDDEDEEDALKIREKYFRLLPRIDYYFSPGGDPGNMPSRDFVDRCIKISRILKKHHKNAKMYPSAQAPHIYKDWGEDFIKELQKCPEEIDGVIYGPNHAYTIDKLRELLPNKYPIRFYPDITHNLRCEYPVHFLDEDWHYAFQSALSRESVNPRPLEMKELNKIYSPYTIGGVSYSEGVHDDLNKMVWSALLWDENTPIKEILLDYARFFMYGAPHEKIADTILMLEKNWYGDPAENPTIDFTYKNLCELKNDYPNLSENWRFLLLYFRGSCDKFIKLKRNFELDLCEKAEKELLKSNPQRALEILNTPLTSSCISIRKELDIVGEKLFKLIGIQLNVKDYHADNWDRGATLDTIDNNITDKAFLISKIKYALTLEKENQEAAFKSLANRNKCRENEVFYSFSLNALKELGVNQEGEFYMDVRGDYPEAQKNSIPMALAVGYDHFNLKGVFGGFQSGCDYYLTLVYHKRRLPPKTHLTIKVNGTIIHKGELTQGDKSPNFDKLMLTEGYESRTYKIPSQILEKGVLTLELLEETVGFKICEIFIKKEKFN